MANSSNETHGHWPLTLRRTKELLCCSSPDNDDNQVSLANIETKSDSSNQVPPPTQFPVATPIPPTPPLLPYTDPVPDQPELQLKRANQNYPPPHSHLETYSMHRGVLFLVNNIHILNVPRRNGAEKDKEMMIHLFRQFGFTIFYYEDLLYVQLRDLLKQLAQSEYIRRVDCLIFGILTHGNHYDPKTYAQFIDGGIVSIEMLIEPFYNANCSFLINKPKIFLFPFCRGDYADQGIENKSLDPNHDASTSNENEPLCEAMYPTMSDIVIIYGSVPGFKTHRDPDDGSWYIREFCRVLAQYSHCMRLHDMLKLIDREVSKERGNDGVGMQTASFEYRGVRKVLYFHPGCENENED